MSKLFEQVQIWQAYLVKLVQDSSLLPVAQIVVRISEHSGANGARIKRFAPLAINFLDYRWRNIGKGLYNFGLLLIYIV